MVIRQNSDYKYESGLSKLGVVRTMAVEDDPHLLVPGEDAIYDHADSIGEIGFTNQLGRLLIVAANIDLDNKMSIGCVGAVMGYLQRRRASEYLQHDPLAEEAYRVSRLEMFTLRNTMLINRDTLSALQILQLESHPNVANQGPGSWGDKESLSVYGLFHNFARTQQGRSRLRQVFLRPSLDIIEINARHDFISIFMRPENQPIGERLSKSLARIKNMRAVIVLLRKGIETGGSNGKIKSGVWASLLEFCFYAIDIGDGLREVNDTQNTNLFNVAVDTLDKLRLRQIGSTINKVVDLDQSLEERRTVIQRGVDEDLDSMKDIYNGIEEMLSEVASEISNAMPPQVSLKFNILFLPQLGYHVVIPINEPNQPIWDGGDHH